MGRQIGGFSHGKSQLFSKAGPCEQKTNAPPLTKVPKSGDDVCLVVQPFIDPSCNLFVEMVEMINILETSVSVKAGRGRTTRSLGYLVQKLLSPSGAEI